jgi:hypothetical protein
MKALFSIEGQLSLTNFQSLYLYSMKSLMNSLKDSVAQVTLHPLRLLMLVFRLKSLIISTKARILNNSHPRINHMLNKTLQLIHLDSQ